MKKELNYLFKEEFLPEMRHAGRLSEETIRGYKSAYELFLKLLPDIVYASDIKVNRMVEFFKILNTRKRIVGRGKEREGVKKSTIATYWSKLNKFFRWLERHSHIEKNPLDKELMDYPDVRYEELKYLDKKEVEKIFNAVEFSIKWKNSIIRKRNILIFIILLTCGLRKGELLGLKNRDIDLERKILIVRAETSKSKMQRAIPLNSLAVTKLKDYFSEKQKFNFGTDYLFISDKQDDGLKQSGIKHLVEKMKEATGVKFHLHQFRHTFAVNMLMKGTDIAKLKQLLGHRDIRMTASYLRCLPTDEMRNDIEALTLDNLI
ncbi:hypothetical protein C0583_04515 [Candidatus Parcubacteria bacterium]|nr:MAG: hypothetical protein C0583_04515 [Candidatus Parcubacteria bacterium]